MTDAFPPDLDPALQGWLARLPEEDRAQLRSVVRHILVHGSLFGSEEPDRSLFRWAWENRPHVEEFLDLLSLDVAWENECYLLQAIPRDTALLLRLKLDATLVLLTLWYELDVAVKDRGKSPPVTITVEQLNESLRTHFDPLKRNVPKVTRLFEILQVARQKNLIRMQQTEPLETTRIHILPTLRRVIPFQDLESWTKAMESLTLGAAETRGSEEPSGDEE